MKHKLFLFITLMVLLTLPVTAEESKNEKHKLSTTEIAGLQSASQALLAARHEARDQDQKDPTRKSLEKFRKELLELRNELMSVQPFSGQLKLIDPSKAGSSSMAADSVTPPPVNNGLHETKIEELANKVIQDVSELSDCAKKCAMSMNVKEHGIRAEVADERVKKITAIQAPLQTLRNKPKEEQIAIVNKLLAQTNLKSIREFGAKTTEGPGGIMIEAPEANMPTPTITTRTKHRE